MLSDAEGFRYFLRKYRIGGTAPIHIECRLSVQILQLADCLLFLLLYGMIIYTHRRSYIGVAEQLRHYLYIHTLEDKGGGEGVTQRVDYVVHVLDISSVENTAEILVHIVG